MILRVGLEVFGEVVDAFAENRDLHFRGSGVGVVGLVAADQFGLAVFAQRHLACPPRTPQNACMGTGCAVCPRNSLVEQDQHVTSEQQTGCKSPAAAAARRSPTRSPSAIEQPDDGRGRRPRLETGSATSSGPSVAAVRRRGRRPRRSARPPARPAASSASGISARRGAGSRSRSSRVERDRLGRASNSPLRVRRSAARCAPTPSRSPRSCASERT